MLAISAPGPLSASEAGERVVVDRSNGSYAGTLWLVGTTPEAEAPFFAVGVARLPEVPLDRSFVLRGGDGGLEEGTAEAADEWLQPGRTVVEVKVAPMTFDLARHLVARWQEGEQSELPPEQRLENLLERVARAAGLDVPYRSVLRGSEPAAFLRDLARINGGG